MKGKVPSYERAAHRFVLVLSSGALADRLVLQNGGLLGVKRKPSPELPPHVKVALWRAAVALLLQNSNQPGEALPSASPDSLTLMERR